MSLTAKRVWRVADSRPWDTQRGHVSSQLDTAWCGGRDGRGCGAKGVALRGVALGTRSGSFWRHIRKMFSEVYPVRQPGHPRKLGEAVSPWRQRTGLIRGRMLGN